jgi:hypothetical protein
MIFDHQNDQVVVTTGIATAMSGIGMVHRPLIAVLLTELAMKT